MKRLSWNKTENDSIIYFTADNRRIQFYSRKNPEQKIYHTILVERNGYIQSVFSGTKYEGMGYQFMGRKVYEHVSARFRVLVDSKLYSLNALLQDPVL